MKCLKRWNKLRNSGLFQSQKAWTLDHFCTSSAWISSLASPTRCMSSHYLLAPCYSETQRNTITIVPDQTINPRSAKSRLQLQPKTEAQRRTQAAHISLRLPWYRQTFLPWASSASPWAHRSFQPHITACQSRRTEWDEEQPYFDCSKPLASFDNSQLLHRRRRRAPDSSSLSELRHCILWASVISSSSRSWHAPASLLLHPFCESDQICVLRPRHIQPGSVQRCRDIFLRSLFFLVISNIQFAFLAATAH